MRFHIHHHFELDPAVLHKLDMLQHQQDRIERILAMAVSPQVQAVLDAINAQPNIAAAIDAGFKAENTQIASLQQQVTDLTAKLNSGGVLSADDLAALASGLTTLQATNASLQTDVPANTTTPASS